MNNSHGTFSIHQKAKLLFLLGDWNALEEIEPASNDQLDDIRHYKLVSLFQQGKIDEARSSIDLKSIKSNEGLIRLLVSGVYNCLGKANYLINNQTKADQYFSDSIDILEFDEFDSRIKYIRKAEQLYQAGLGVRWEGFSSLGSQLRRKKLFIDCGGYDGCSVIKFLMSNPGYDVISFEANPELWKYYSGLPTTLIGKAVHKFDGEVEFTIDPFDGDGSSLVKEKEIDFYKKIKNEDCPKITVPCIDLSSFIKEQSRLYDHLVLKLDVEGAEYEILEKMLADKTINYISKLYAEFHWQKIGISQERHEKLLKELNRYVPIEHWDAHEFSVHGKDKSAIKRRFALLNLLGC